MEKVIGIESIESILASVRVKGRPKGVFTTQDMMDRTKRHNTWCREQIRLLMGAGKAKYAGQVQATRIDGRPTLVPGYQLVKR